MKTRRPTPPILRFVVVGILVVVPSFAKPPHAPDEQYDLYTKDTTVIFDKQTGLKWDRFIPTNTASFFNAALYCKTTFGGRLPTIKELLTLIDELPHPEYEGGVTVTKLIDPDAFGYEKAPIDRPYLTSTPAELGANPLMWTLDFSTGAMARKSQSEALHYRCVK